MKKQNSGNQLHSGHRERLRERFLSEGLSGFNDHNILELLLFYALPRVDTNELAHRLLDRFGSLSRVFDADIADIAAVPGMGEKSAALIKLIPQLSSAYRMDKFFPDSRRMDMREIGEFLTEYFADKDEEIMVTLLLDNAGRMISCDEQFRGTVDAVQIDARKLLESVMVKKPTSVVVAHNHPRGVLVPSNADIKTTKTLEDIFETAGIKMRDHLLVAGESWLSVTHYRELNLTRYEPVYYFEPQKVTILPTTGKPKKKK